jgi:hypothetical protein
MDEKKEYNDIGTNRDVQVKKNEPSYGLTPLRHLASLCAFYKLKRFADLGRVQFGTSSDQLDKLEEALRVQGVFQTIEKHTWPSPAATAYHLWPKEKMLAGVGVIVSRIAPFFYTEMLRREAWDQPLDFNLPTAKEIMESEVYQNYVAALKKPIPSAAKRLHDKILPTVASAGFIYLPQTSLNRRPRLRGVPGFLQRRPISFFYFHSMDWN